MSENSVDTRAVPALPFLMSQANQEFMDIPTGAISLAMIEAGLGTTGLVSRFAGMTSYGVIKLTIAHHTQPGSELGHVVEFWGAHTEYDPMFPNVPVIGNIENKDKIAKGLPHLMSFFIIRDTVEGFPALTEDSVEVWFTTIYADNNLAIDFTFPDGATLRTVGYYAYGGDPFDDPMVPPDGIPASTVDEFIAKFEQYMGQTIEVIITINPEQYALLTPVAPFTESQYGAVGYLTAPLSYTDTVENAWDIDGLITYPDVQAVPTTPVLMGILDPVLRPPFTKELVTGGSNGVDSYITGHVTPSGEWWQVPVPSLYAYDDIEELPTEGPVTCNIVYGPGKGNFVNFRPNALVGAQVGGGTGRPHYLASADPVSLTGSILDAQWSYDYDGDSNIPVNTRVYMGIIDAAAWPASHQTFDLENYPGQGFIEAEVDGRFYITITDPTLNIGYVNLDDMYWPINPIPSYIPGNIATRD